MPVVVRADGGETIKSAAVTFDGRTQEAETRRPGSERVPVVCPLRYDFLPNCENPYRQTGGFS